jgi:hypothetical protein
MTVPHSGGRLVLVHAQVDRVRDARQELRELEVDGRRVGRVRGRDDERVDRAGRDLLDERAQRLRRPKRRDRTARGVADRRPTLPSAELIARGERVHGRRLAAARDDDGAAAVALEVRSRRP